MTGGPLVVGLVNNMPDAALRSTERQFRELLAAAAAGRRVTLRVFADRRLPRSPAAWAYLGDRYEDVDALWESALDGLIVTGTEPRAARVDAEAPFPLLARLVDWAEDRALPTIWSCLAAHAAVYYLDGVERRSYARKLSGVFRCTPAGEHASLGPAERQPRLVPHSRCNEIPEESLRAAGYRILSRSDEAAVDMFTRAGDSPFLFLQGHPEYDSGALLREYRRDIGRFLAHERPSYPEMPAGYVPEAAAAALFAFREQALRQRIPELLAEFPEQETARQLAAPWRAGAVRLYANWLSGLARHRAGEGEPARVSAPAATVPDPSLALP